MSVGYAITPPLRSLVTASVILSDIWGENRDRDSGRKSREVFIYNECADPRDSLIKRFDMDITLRC